MSPNSTRAFAARLAEDDAFRAHVAKNPRAALAEYGVADEAGLVPDSVVLPGKEELAALGLAKKPKPEPTPAPAPEPTRPTPVSVQLFDPS
jgi:putative modified peptide